MLEIPILHFAAMYPAQPKPITPFPVLDISDADVAHALTLLCSGMQVGD